MNNSIATTKPLRSYQLEALDQSEGKPGFAFFMEQRTGKTPTTIKDVERSYKAGEIEAVIVACPKSIITDWVGIKEDETGFAYWFEGNQHAVPWKNGSKMDPTLTSTGGDFLRVFVVNYDALIRDTGIPCKTILKMLALFKCAFILDESQRIKTPSAKRTKQCLKIASVCDMVRILSGTPNAESPLNLWTQGRAIRIAPRPKRMFVFRNRYAVLQMDQSTQRIVENVLRDLLADHGTFPDKFTHAPGEKNNMLLRTIIETSHGNIKSATFRAGKAAVKVGILFEGEYYWETAKLPTPAYFQEVSYRNTEELQGLLKPYSYRITRKEAWPETPDKQYSKIYVELGPKQRKVYNELVRKLRIELQGQEVTVKIALTKLLRLQQVIGGFVNSDEGKLIELPDCQRIGMLMDYLEDLEGKVIIWARFTPEIDAIMKALKAAGHNPVRFDGKTSDADREEAKRSFRFGDATHFVVNIAAGDVGLTLDSAQTAIYYSNHPSLEKRLQSEDRPVSKTNKVQIVDMIAENTVEIKTIQSLRNKRDLSSTLMGDELLSWI